MKYAIKIGKDWVRLYLEGGDGDLGTVTTVQDRRCLWVDKDLASAFCRALRRFGARDVKLFRVKQ